MAGGDPPAVDGLVASSAGAADPGTAWRPAAGKGHDGDPLGGDGLADSEPSTRAHMVLWLLPPLCACVLFAPCASYSEWYVDELFAVLRNEDARGETSFQQVFSNDFWGNPLRGGKGSWTHKSYRPLAVLSFAVQFRFLGGDLFRPQPLRAFNAAVHGLNSSLLQLLLRRGLRLSRRWSCVAACLFAAHPVHVENVVYLVGRADAMATTAWLLAFLAQLRVRGAAPRCRPPRPLAMFLLLALCTALAVLGGLCKESGFTLLVFVAGFELSTPQAAPRRGACVALAALGLFAAVGYARVLVTQGTSANFGFVDTPVQYYQDVVVRTMSYLLQHAFYAKLLVLPGDLSWDYSYDSIPLMRATCWDLRVLGICSTYLAVAALSAWSLRVAGGGRRRVLLGLQHLIVPFVPASNLFFTVGVTVGERLLYPSTVGAAVVVASVGQRLEGRRPGRPRGSHCPFLLACLLFVVYAWRCGVRVWQWRSSEALYMADAAAWPRSVKTRHQLATVYHAQGRYGEALENYNASLMVLDDNALTDHCIAQIYVETNQFQRALERFEKILRGHGVGFSQFNLWMLYVDYGFTLVSLSRHDDAVPVLKQGLKMNEAVPHGLNALGYAHASLQQLQQAQDVFAKGLEYDPENPVIWNNLAVVWMVAGAIQQAAKGFEQALVLEPGHQGFVHNAILLKKLAETGQLMGTPRLELFFARSS